MPGVGVVVDDHPDPGQDRRIPQGGAICDRSERGSNRFIASPSCEHQKADPPDVGLGFPDRSTLTGRRVTI